MKLDLEDKPKRSLSFHGGSFGALLPFVVFVGGVITIALSGAPDEKGFWPVLVIALAVGLFLSKDKTAFSETVIDGMSNRIVMIMITAWILASTVGILMSITGLVDALIWISVQLNLRSVGFIIASFLICSLVSLSTGSSFATILICGPILYPAGGLLEAHLPTLAGVILGGATFGDFTAPISDTTIASALSQRADIGATVKSRIKYIIPAAALALIAYSTFGFLAEPTRLSAGQLPEGSPKGLPMLLIPVVIIYMFLKKKHLLHGLLTGLIFGIVLGLILGLLSVDQLISLDLENFTAKSFIVDGISRAVGISFFTILLMGLVGTLRASGLIDKVIVFASNRIKNQRQGETWIASVVGAALLLTTHSIVAILMISDFSNQTGEKNGISGVRRANLLSLMACVLPFLLPYFIPTILMANMTSSGADFGIPTVSPLEVGMHNFLSWALLLLAIIVVIFGFGRQADSSKPDDHG